MNVPRRTNDIYNSMKSVVEYPILSNDVKPIFINLLKYIKVGNKHAKEVCRILKKQPTNRVIHRRLDRTSYKLQDLHDSKYFPKHIREYIVEYMRYNLVYKINLVNPVTITFALTEYERYNKEHLKEFEDSIEFILTWLYVCGIYSKGCVKTLDITVYPTPFEKQLPTISSKILDSNNVNSAFTYYCAKEGSIVIYRKEEWRKVFIHETIHAYGLDFASHDCSQLVNQMKRLFPVKSEYRISEAYTESWARILNCMMTVFFNSISPITHKTFLYNIQHCLGIERLYAARQCEKILTYIGLPYTTLIDPSKALYSRNLFVEKSNVLSYYIITAVLLSDYSSFMLWCSQNNSSLLKFTNTNYNYRNFGMLIEELARSDDFISLLKLSHKMKKHETNHMKNSLTMSAIESI